MTLDELSTLSGLPAEYIKGILGSKLDEFLTELSKNIKGDVIELTRVLGVPDCNTYSDFDEKVNKEYFGEHWGLSEHWNSYFKGNDYPSEDFIVITALMPVSNIWWEATIDRFAGFTDEYEISVKDKSSNAFKIIKVEKVGPDWTKGPELIKSRRNNMSSFIIKSGMGYNLGFRAALEGKSTEDNPFKHGKPGSNLAKLSADWTRGFADGCEVDPVHEAEAFEHLQEMEDWAENAERQHEMEEMMQSRRNNMDAKKTIKSPINSANGVVVEHSDGTTFDSSKEYYDQNLNKISKPKSIQGFAYVYAVDNGFYFKGTTYSSKEEVLKEAIKSSREGNMEKTLGYDRVGYIRIAEENGQYRLYIDTELKETTEDPAVKDDWVRKYDVLIESSRSVTSARGEVTDSTRQLVRDILDQVPALVKVPSKEQGIKKEPYGSDHVCYYYTEEGPRKGSFVTVEFHVDPTDLYTEVYVLTRASFAAAGRDGTATQDEREVTLDRFTIEDLEDYSLAEVDRIDQAVTQGFEGAIKFDTRLASSRDTRVKQFISNSKKFHNR